MMLFCIPWVRVASIPLSYDHRPNITHAHYCHEIDLGTMEKRAEAKKYLDYDSFLADAQLIWDNCRTYNSEQSVFWKNANKLEKRLKDIVARLRL